MRTDVVERTLVTSPIEGQSAFAISTRYQTEIMVLLRDSLYSDKVLAVLREYSANAWDAHRDAGKHDVPIKVVLPTHLEPTLVIRDYGLGLSEEDVLHVYTQYGASTKRESNDVVGALGIGSKSAFCYTDQFTVTSWHGGVIRVFVASLDSSNVGIMQKLMEGACEATETGVEIKIAVRRDDVRAFHDKARTLYRFFVPTPDVNTSIHVPSKSFETPFGFSATNCHPPIVAVMGCIPYTLDFSILTNLLEDAGLETAADHFRGGLFFKIGEVEVAGSREALKFSDYTKNAVVKRFGEMVNSYAEQLSLVFDDPARDPWSKRALALSALSFTGKRTTGQLKLWGVTSVVLPISDTPMFKVFTGHGDISKTVTISEGLTFFLHDCTGKSIQGFGLSSYHRVVEPEEGITLEQAEVALTAMLSEVNLTGVPVKRLSDLRWNAPFVPTPPVKRVPHVNHRRHVFEFIRYESQQALGWKAVERVPLDTDVFVVLRRFESTRTTENFYSEYSYAESAATVLGVSLPVIYGYKDSKKRPIAEKDCKGTQFNDWLPKFFGKLLVGPHLTAILGLTWQRHSRRRYAPYCYKKHVPSIQAAVGEDHPIAQAYSLISGLQREYTGHEERAYHWLSNVCSLPPQPVVELLDALTVKYPLLEGNYQRLTLLDNASEAWIRYVKLIDADDAKNTTITPQGAKLSLVSAIGKLRTK